MLDGGIFESKTTGLDYKKERGCDGCFRGECGRGMIGGIGHDELRKEDLWNVEERDCNNLVQAV